MKTFEAYQSADGQLWLDEEQAIARDTDILGEELDGLLRHVFAVENITRTQEYKACMHALSKRQELKKACEAILKVFDHTDSI